MLHVVTAAEMRELDRQTIEDIGIPGAVLMETAGRRLAGAVLALEAGEPVAIVCGTGNNGGDGFVCGRVLREHGVLATVYLAGPAEAIAGDALVHFGAYRECGGVVVSIAESAALEAAEIEISRAAVVVDAIFGTGLARDVTGHYADVVEIINGVSGIVVACDVPSGLDADSGQALGTAVRADITVTMAFAKRGLVGEPGFTYVGDLQIVEIGIPTVLGGRARVGFFEDDDAFDLLPWPTATDHKHQRGSVLVIAGSAGHLGAARLASRAALRAGAGLVTWATGSPAQTNFDPIMTRTLDRDHAPAEFMGELLAGANAVVIGPGLADDAWGRTLVTETLSRSAVPVVVDAMGLTLLGAGAKTLAETGSDVVITPHPGEAARLLETKSVEIQRDRLAAARRLAGLGAVAVLKGARTIVDDGELATINGTGNAGMATAGSGDVLAGLIGGLIAQGLAAADAARLAVYLHGLAGDLASETLGPLSVTADDIAGSIAAAIGELAE